MHYTYTILTYYIICVSIELENKYSSSRTVGMFLLEFHPEVSNPNWWISINCQTLHIFYTFYFKLHFEGLFIQENRTSNSNIGWRYQQKYYANNVFIKYYLRFKPWVPTICRRRHGSRRKVYGWCGGWKPGWLTWRFRGVFNNNNNE